MGNYADKHGGNSFFGNLVTVATHPFNSGQAIQNKYQAQADFQNTLAATQNLFTQTAANQAAAQAQADTSAAAQADAAKSNTVKYVLIAGGVIVAIIGLVVGIKFLKNRKKKTA